MDSPFGGGGDDTLSDPDGVASAAGDSGDDSLALYFDPEWNHLGTQSLPSGAISGGAGDDMIRVTSNSSSMKFARLHAKPERTWSNLTEPEAM